MIQGFQSLFSDILNKMAMNYRDLQNSFFKKNLFETVSKKVYLLKDF